MRTLRTGLFAFPLLGLLVSAQAVAGEPEKAPEAAPATASVQMTTSPISTSGTDLMPADSGPLAAAAGAGGTAADAATIAAMKARLDALEAEVKEKGEAKEKEPGENEWWKHVEISGFVQPQLYWQTANAAGSVNATATGLPTGIGSNQVIARSDGSTSNTDGFRIRRAWLKTDLSPIDSVHAIFEFDPSTLAGGAQDGVTTIVRHLEAQGITRFRQGFEILWAAGVFVPPFGFELQQEHTDRPFVEQSWGMRNWFPGEFDTGAHAHGTAFHKKLTIDLAIVNGVTEGEKGFSLSPDLNHAKDFVGRANYDFGCVDVGASVYAGEGQAIDVAALRFKNFRRDAVDFEAAYHQRLAEKLGWTRAYGELALGTNMDRGANYAFALPAIPQNITGDVSNLGERSLMVRVEQDFGRWITGGIRYDFYTPEAAVKNDGRDAYGVVGVVHFTKYLQLMVEYDHAIDNIHLKELEAPSRHVDAGSAVLQAKF